MSSGNDREIRIGVSADTSGAIEARRRLEEVKVAAEAAAEASSSVRALGDGGLGGGRVDTKSVEEMTDAIREQVEANGFLIDTLDELTDAEAGVIRSTGKVSEEFKKLSEEGKKEDGFGKLFSPDKMEGIKSGFLEVGKAVGVFAKEFAKTEEGQKLLEGLPEGLKVFGETALSVADSVAKGFSTGGPIGGAVSGLAALIEHVGKEYLDAQERIKASDEEWAQAQEDHAEKLREKALAAAEAGIAERTEDENERLRDQNDILKENADLMKSRRDLADSEFELKQAKERAAGKPEEVLKAEKIQHDLKRKEEETNEAERKRLEERKAIQERGFQARMEADRIEKTPGLGNQSDEYKKQMEIAHNADGELEDRERSDKVLDEQGRIELQADRNSGAARIIGLRSEYGKRQERESRKKQDEEKRERDKTARQQRTAERNAAKDELEGKREGLDEMAMESAGKFSRAADFLKSSGRSPELAKMLGGAGKGLADGADEKEIARISKEFAEVTKGMNGPVLDALQKMLDAQAKQAGEIMRLQGQLKREVSGKH